MIKTINFKMEEILLRVILKSVHLPFVLIGRLSAQNGKRDSKRRLIHFIKILD